MLSSLGLAGNGKNTGKEALIKNAIESFINIHRNTKPKSPGHYRELVSYGRVLSGLSLSTEVVI